MKKLYILKQRPEDIDADPMVIDALRRFVDYQLSLEGEMAKALNAEALGKHKEEV